MQLPRHRVLYNGDCNFLFTGSYGPQDGSAFPASVVTDYIDLLADSGVDIYLCNGNGQIPWYPSRQLPHVLTGYSRGDRNFSRGHYPPCDDGFTPAMLEKRIDTDIAMLNRLLDLQEAGVDWMALVADHCRRRNVTPWASIRMNDAHGANSWENSYFNCALQKDPRYRLSGHGCDPGAPPSHFLQMLNYEHAEVRDYHYQMIRELLEEYEYDGIELDWLRTAWCCQPPASEKTIAAMTDWMASLRRLTQERSARSGRPCPLGVRVPVRTGLLRAVGMDIDQWISQGLIDFVGVSNFWQTSWDVPYDQMRRQWGEQVTLVGVIEDAPNWLHTRDPQTGRQGYRLLSSSPPLIRGNAASKLALGADAIEFFNFFCTDHKLHNRDSPLRAQYPAMREIASLDPLRGQPKQYTLATSHGYWMYSIFEYAEQLPTALPAQAKAAFRLSMCAEPDPDTRDVVVQLVYQQPADGAAPLRLGVSFNSSWPQFEAEATDRLLFPAGFYTHHMPEHAAINFRFPRGAIREGWNEILVINNSPTETNPVQIQSVEVAVGV